MDTATDLKRKAQTQIEAPPKEKWEKKKKRQEIDSLSPLFQDAFKALTINSRGLRNPLNNSLLFDLIEKSGCDICFIQETLVSSDANIKALSRQWLGHSFWSPAIGRQGGVAVLFSPRFSHEVRSRKKDSNGHVISILVRVDGVNLNFVNVYVPTNLTDRKSFFKSLYDFLSLRLLL